MRKKTITLSAAVVAVAAITGFNTLPERQQMNNRPNFLFVLVDDQSPFDLNIYNASSILETYNISKLAEEGMVFESARHMGSMVGAVCTPSRHMIMSGRTLWHIPSQGNGPHNTRCPENLELETIGAVFNRYGYSTMRTCKVGNSYPAANKQFSVVRDATKRDSTDETGSAWHARQVLNFLDDRKENNDLRPFFIYFGFSPPHDIRNGPPDLLRKYGAINHTDKNSTPPTSARQPALPENYLPAHPFPIGHPNLRDEEEVSGVWKKRDEQTIRNEYGREFACAENIDIQLGKVLRKLEETGEIDNTYIIYTSDHGIAVGRHGLMGKQNLYEHSWRVPFIVKGPNIKAGQRVEGNIYLHDILPTVCDLAEIPIPRTVEGQSFKPVLTGAKNSIRSVMYGAYCGGTKPGIRCIKKGNWKLIKYDVMNGTIRKTQLFDLAKNPHEYLPEHRQSDPLKTNLADNPGYAEKRMEMESLLLSQMQSLDDPYRFWNQKQGD